jgi:hypothetical protein
VSVRSLPPCLGAREGSGLGARIGVPKPSQPDRQNRADHDRLVCARAPGLPRMNRFSVVEVIENGGAPAQGARAGHVVCGRGIDRSAVTLPPNRLPDQAFGRWR